MTWLLWGSKRQHQWQETPLISSSWPCPGHSGGVLSRWGHGAAIPSGLAHLGCLLCAHWPSQRACSILQGFSQIFYWKCASTVLSVSNPDHRVVWPSHNDKFWYNFKWHKLSILQMQLKAWNTYADSCSKSWPKGGRKMLQKGQAVINILWMQLCAVFLLNNFSFPI